MQYNYIHDLQTKNTSFLATAVDLKRLGIKNHKFMLRLYNRRLVGVDPHNPHLPPEVIAMVITECIINPWYYLREVARVPAQGKPEGIPFGLHRGNLASIWGLLNGINTYLVIPRQTGKTESTISILTWAFLFGMTNSEMMFLNFEQSRAEANLEKIKIQRDLLPVYLRMKYGFNDETGKPEEGIDNVRRITSPITGNSIVVKGKAVSKEAANKIGRGSTQPIQYIDEFEFINFIDVIMSASGPAFTSASRNARENKSLYGRIITSTPGDIDTSPGEAAARFLEGCAQWTEQFYDWDRDRIYDYMAKNSANNTVYIQYSYQQLGKDEQWFRENCESIGDITTIKRDILLQRIRGSNLSPFDQEDLEQLYSRRGTVIEEITLLKIFILKLYAKIDKNRIYFIGVDVSNGYNLDNSAVTVWDPYTQKTVAEFKSPLIGVPDLTKFIILLMKNITPNGLIIIERNANGEAVISAIRESMYAHRLYFDNRKTFNDLDKTADPYVAEARNRQAYGVWTGRDTRPRLFDLLTSYVIDYKDKIVGENIINDIMNLVKGKTGKIEAGKGYHDDCVMSYLLCLFVYYYGNNLYRYGFQKGHLPGEGEANQGLYSNLSYESTLNMLSEEEQALFDTVRVRNTDGFDENLADVIRMASKMREDGLKAGVLSKDEIDDITYSGSTKVDMSKMDPHQLQAYTERERYLREAEAIGRKIGAINTINSYNGENGDILDESDDFFDSFMGDLLS